MGWVSIMGYKLMGNLGGEIVTIDLPGAETRKLFMFQLLDIGLGYKGGVLNHPTSMSLCSSTAHFSSIDISTCGL